WHFSKQDALIEISLPEYKGAENTFWKATIRLHRGKRSVFSLVIHDFAGKPISDQQAAIKPAIHLDEADIKRQIALVGGVMGNLKPLFEAFALLARCFYCPSTRHATAFVPDSTSRSLFDIQVGKPFIDDWQQHQQGADKSCTETIETIVTDIQRLFRYDRLQIQTIMGTRDLLILANGKSLRLSDLGAGLAQFIVLLGNVAFRNPSWILVDEPELNLHPALQLEFLQAVAARATEGVVFATHSLGLARQVAERIYTFSQKTGRTTVQPIEQTNNLAQLIGELSFGRIDFSARKILLVEGQLDVLTFQALLSIINREHEFAIIALGGSGGINSRRKTELEHLAALSLQMFAVIDSEKDSQKMDIEKHRNDFQQMCVRLDVNCHILQKRAIENYFTQRAINAALGEGRYKALRPYQKLASVPHHWDKRKNWMIAREMQWNEIRKTDIGKWLAQLKRNTPA
ncbi:MAG TPA: AAA family ATPase, partial [Verrucomicrobiae bacterium]|nr:AAA family ATPase [Verrucomicrobiae bacterium]